MVEKSFLNLDPPFVWLWRPVMLFISQVGNTNCTYGKWTKFGVKRTMKQIVLCSCWFVLLIVPRVKQWTARSLRPCQWHPRSPISIIKSFSCTMSKITWIKLRHAGGAKTNYPVLEPKIWIYCLTFFPSVIFRDVDLFPHQFMWDNSKFNKVTMISNSGIQLHMQHMLERMF